MDEKKDPSQQIDEEQLEESVEKEADEVVSPETEDETLQDESQDSESEEESEEEEEKPKEKTSRRENLRIQKLVAKLKEKEEQLKPKFEGGLDYRKTLEADDAVYEQLENDRKDFGKAQYDLGLQQAKALRFHTRLELDAPKVAQKYPQLDQDSSDFNSSIATAINEWYLATVGYDPKSDTVKNADVRYAEFVEGIMELADEMAGKKIETTKKNITKQAASMALRPDGSSAKRLNLNKAPEAMTDEELDAIIGSAIPKKR